MYTKNGYARMDVKKGLRERLNELIEYSGKTEKELSKALGTSCGVISKWRRGDIDPKLRSVIKLADFFECSLEYMCGKTEYDTYYERKDVERFGERLPKVLKACNKTAYRLIKDTRITSAQYAHWRKGIEPLLSSAEEIAEYLGITLDYLVGRDN